MTMERRLLASRVFNDTGDWFYYFVIVVIIYGMSQNPIMMGILSASYTIPGFLLSQKLAKLIDHLDDQKTLVAFDFMRVLILIGIVLTNNVWLALICVFLEQVFAIGSNLSFQRVTIDVISNQQKLLTFNRHLKIFSNISRLLVIPAYLILHQFISNKLILGLDILFTLISLFETVRIKMINSNGVISNKTSNYKFERLRWGKVTKTIIIFSCLNLCRSFVDAYGIMYIGLTSKKVDLGYAALVFIMSIADLMGGIFSKRLVKVDNISQNIFLKISFVIILLLFGIPAITRNVFCFIGCIFLIRLILAVLELFVLYRLQVCVPQKIHQYIALQTMLIDGLSLGNSLFGGIVIQKTSVFYYMGIILLIIFLSGIFFEWKKD